MNKFNRFMFNALLVFIGIIALSFLLLYSYMDKEDLTLKEIFESPSSYFSIHYNGDFFERSSSKRNPSSKYETIQLYEEETFAPLQNLNIESSIESIHFVYEDRNDIFVVFERDVPDTSNYVLTYKAREVNDTLHIEVNMDINGLYTDRDYVGSITLYLPKEHVFEQVDIISHITDYKLILPVAEEIDLDVNYGTLQLETTHNFDKLTASMNAGDLELNLQNNVTFVDLSVDTGTLKFDIDQSVNHLIIQNNVGEINGKLMTSPTIFEVDCNIGDVQLVFDKNIKSLDASLNIGDLNIEVDEDDESVVYVNTDLVDYNSQLKRTNKKSEANIWIDMNLGEIDINN